MKAEEAYSTRRSEFTAIAESQIKDGIEKSELAIRYHSVRDFNALNRFLFLVGEGVFMLYSCVHVYRCVFHCAAAS